MFVFLYNPNPFGLWRLLLKLESSDGLGGDAKEGFPLESKLVVLLLKVGATSLELKGLLLVLLDGRTAREVHVERERREEGERVEVGGKERSSSQFKAFQQPAGTNFRSRKITSSVKDQYRLCSRIQPLTCQLPSEVKLVSDEEEGGKIKSKLLLTLTSSSFPLVLFSFRSSLPMDDSPILKFGALLGLSAGLDVPSKRLPSLMAVKKVDEMLVRSFLPFRPPSFPLLS